MVWWQTHFTDVKSDGFSTVMNSILHSGSLQHHFPVPSKDLKSWVLTEQDL